VRPRDNVPVLSWLLLRGRCRDCSAAISARSPLVEVLTAVVFAVLGWRLLALDQPAAVPAYLYLGAIGVALALIDIDHRRLPDVITFPSYLVGPALLLLPAVVHDRWGDYRRALIGMAALWLFYWTVKQVGDLFYGSGKSMGWGDVKLSGILGLYLAWLGWRELVTGAFLGFLVGAVFGVVAIVAGGVAAKARIPYGPHMIVGALLAVVVGRTIADLYLGSLGV
jgi:leader peptidase (prepilin peptidase)/N-methyltransferase